MKTKIFAMFFFFFVIQLKSQTISNLDIFLNQIDSSVITINAGLTNINRIKVNFTSPPSLSFLKNQTLTSFAKNKIISDSADVIVGYNLNEAIVKYDNPERENFFGDFLVDRIIELRGSAFIQNKSEITGSEKMFLHYKDKISVDEIKNLQNSSLSFTEGKIPEEPFLSSLYEPLIAVSAIAVSVYLFFTVRSK